MKKNVRVDDLTNHLSEHRRSVQGGDEVVMFDHDGPIARIVPITTRQRKVHLVRPTRDFAQVRDRRRRRVGWSVASSILLLEERGDR